MLPVAMSLISCPPQEISSVKLSMPSAVLSHLQHNGWEQNSTAQGDEPTGSEVLVGSDSFLKVVWGCLSKYSGVFSF